MDRNENIRRMRELAESIVALNGALEVNETGKPRRALHDYAPELARLVLELDSASNLQTVYVVSGGNFGEDDPAAFEHPNDAETYAGLVNGSVARLLVCDRDLARTMIRQEREMFSEWVVCAPGDPTDLQWEVIRANAGENLYCAERWNQTTGEVKFVVSQSYGGDVHQIVDLAGKLTQVSEADYQKE